MALIEFTIYMEGSNDIKIHVNPCTIVWVKSGKFGNCRDTTLINTVTGGLIEVSEPLSEVVEKLK